MTLTDVAVRGNGAQATGGPQAIADGLSVALGSTATLNRVEVSDNVAVGAVTNLGGGMITSGTSTVTNSTFAGNTAGQGGALYNAGGANTTLNSSTLAFNTATEGRNIYVAASSTATARNTIFGGPGGSLCAGPVAVTPAGATLNDVTPPACAITALRADNPRQMDVTVSDNQSELNTVVPTLQQNAVINVPWFQRGTRNPVVVTATKVDQAQVSRWAFQADDLAGNSRLCT